MKPRKTKSGEPSLRERLSQKFLEALEADFQAYGTTVLEKMRESHPERYAELAAKMIMTAEPPQPAKGLAAANSMQEVGRILLQQVGLPEPTDEEIEEAIKANDVFLAQLEAIKNRAQFRELGNGNAQGELGLN
jgi:hypothetical protein